MTLKPEHIVEELNRTPKLKRDLIMKMMEVMLDSEAFLEAYPRLYDLKRARTDATYREKVREEMAWIIVRMFCKNRVHPDDARDALSRAKEYYWELCMHSDRAYSIALSAVRLTARPPASGRQRSMRFRSRCWEKTWLCCCGRVWMYSSSIAAQRRSH